MGYARSDQIRMPPALMSREILSDLRSVELANEVRIGWS
jgi:hypothetical protein